MAARFVSIALAFKRPDNTDTQMSEWTGVILAAGQGTRMKSDLPKTLHTVCGKPLIGHVVDVMQAAGAQRVVAVVSPSIAEMPELVDAVGKDVSIAIQPTALGTAHALECAREVVGPAQTIVVGAGDMALVKSDSILGLVQSHAESESVLSVLTATVGDPYGFGRIVRNEAGSVQAIVEEVDATPEQKLIHEMNTGLYCIDAPWCWGQLEQLEISSVGEKFLTDLVAPAASSGRATTAPVSEVTEALGVNTRIQLAEVEAAMRDRIRRRHMLAGVTIRDPETTYIDADVEIGRDTELLPGNHLRAGTRIGTGCEIGPNSILKDCSIGEGARVISSHIEGAEIGEGISVGPFSRIRPGTVIESGAYIGNFAEIKNSRVGSGTHVGHFSYVGDSELGRDVNIGAGTVTANFDGVNKHQTVIGDRVKIGSDSIIVPPVTIGDDANTGAGSVVNRDVAAGDTVIGVPAKPISQRKNRDSGDDSERG